MATQVVNGAQMTCSFGTTPASLVVLPANRVTSSNQPDATIMDHVPMTNIPSFGMCTTPTNPQVATATTAALGVLTPQPCLPVTQSPWAPGAPNLQIANMPALDNTSKCTCNWGGIISFMMAGQTQHEIP
jgi:hypothetical protein